MTIVPDWERFTVYDFTKLFITSLFMQVFWLYICSSFCKMSLMLSGCIRVSDQGVPNERQEYKWPQSRKVAKCFSFFLQGVQTLSDKSNFDIRIRKNGQIS